MNDCALAFSLLALDPGLGGIVIRGPAGERRDAMLADFRALLPGAPWRRVPLHVSEDRLLGGLDLAATLAAGRKTEARGLLAEAAGGVLVLTMAERISPGAAARIAHAFDAFEVGAGFRLALLDEGTEDEQAPAALRDRCAFAVSSEELADWSERERQHAPPSPDGMRDGKIAEALCAAADALGIGSARAATFALRSANAHAAFDGRETATEEDAAIAARLVLAWRATRLPPAEQSAETAPDSPDDQGDQPPPSSSSGDNDEDRADSPLQSMDDMVVQAAVAALPPGLLLALKTGRPASRAQAAGKSGAEVKGKRHGRPAGARRGSPREGARLAVIDTLHAAAPWQRIRNNGEDDKRIRITRDDFRVIRTKPRAETTTIFAVDASGSAALARLAEAKGAVERLLAECYIRRDRVAVVAFRGKEAEILLPPTRSLVRAKRGLAAFPGGGGTPLASGLIAAASLADAARRRGETPAIVLLTDGRANVARDGAGGRARAEADATEAARKIAGEKIACLLIDTSVRPQPIAQKLAADMRARYLPLPNGNAAVMSQAIRALV